MSKLLPARSTHQPQEPVAPFIIREARRQDVGAIVMLWKEMMAFHAACDVRFRFTPDAPKDFQNHLMSTLRSRAAYVLVAQAHEQVIGYIMGEVQERKPIYPAGKYAFISDICVTAAHRRSGVGRALVQNLLERFQQRGVTAVELFVAEANPVSVAFWQAMGFKNYLRMLRLDLPSEK